jgi:hypothetical protein
MIKTVNAILAFLTFAGLVGVYALKFSSEDIAAEKVQLERKIERQSAELSLLKAGWSALNQPLYVAPIVQRHQVALNLYPTRQEQFGTLANLPLRAPPPDPAALDDLFHSLDAGVDPIGQLIETN